MGVTGLLGLLKSIQKPTHLREFRGQTIGVDAYGWLHRGAVACAIDLALGKLSTKYVEYALHRVRMLVYFGVTPYLVFDGDRLPSKAATEQGRAERRQESRSTGLELLRLGRKVEAHQELQKAIDITPEMAGQLIEELRRSNIQYVVAPYEADSQLVYLEQRGLIDGILSEDSDLLIFGAKTLLTKLDPYGECIMIRQVDYTSCKEINLTGWSCADLRRMAILSGCDYLDGIHKMGLKTAYRLVRKCKTIQRVIQCAQLEGKFRIPTGYLESFNQAEMTFLYQWVYCPTAKKLVNLTYPEPEDLIAGLTYIGDYVEPEIARGIAAGELNPMNKLPMRVEWPSDYKRPPLITSRRGKENEVQNNNKKIDSFFTPKPNRVPLAELDPNSFAPSQAQRRILDENNGRSWTPSQANSGSTPSQPLRVNIHNQPPRNAGSAPHPHKRQRLCAEEYTSNGDAVLEERSKFFSAKPVKEHATARSRRSKGAKDTTINIWSDDSVEDAMAAIFQPDSFVKESESLNGALKQRSINSSEYFKAKHNLPKKGDTQASEKLASPDTPSEADEDKSPFSAGLQAQIKDLRERYSLSSVPSRGSGKEESVACEPPLRSPTPFGRTTSPTSHIASDEYATGAEQDPNATVEETPIGKSEAKLPESPLDGRAHTPRAPTSQRKAQLGPMSVSRTVTPKGSEDLLLVPDSDADTERGANSASASPERIPLPADDEQASDDNDAGETARSQRPRPAFDLAQFTFSGRTLQFAAT